MLAIGTSSKRRSKRHSAVKCCSQEDMTAPVVRMQWSCMAIVSSYWCICCPTTCLISKEPLCTTAWCPVYSPYHSTPESPASCNKKNYLQTHTCNLKPSCWDWNFCHMCTKQCVSTVHNTSQKSLNACLGCPREWPQNCPLNTHTHSHIKCLQECVTCVPKGSAHVSRSTSVCGRTRMHLFHNHVRVYECDPAVWTHVCMCKHRPRRQRMRIWSVVSSSYAVLMKRGLACDTF